MSASPSPEPTTQPRQDAAPAARIDGAILSLVSGMGTGADPQTWARVASLAVGLEDPMTEEQVASLLCEYGPQRFVEEPADDAVRKGFDLTVDLAAGEGEQGEITKRIMDRLEELPVRGAETDGVLEALRQALIFDRAHGGAALIPWMDDGRSVEEGLETDDDGLPQGVQAIRSLQVVSRHELETPTESDIDQDPKSPGYGYPLRWRLTPVHAFESRDRMRSIHRDRIFVLRGWCPARRLRPYDWGWSVLNRFKGPWSEYRQALRGGMAAANRAAETRLPMENLFDLIAAGKRDDVMRYLQEAHTARSNFRFFPYEAPKPNGPDTTPKDATLQLSGAAQLIEMARQDVAAAAGVTAARFFGLAHEGMSDNDETGAQRDEASIARYQRRKLLPALNWIIGLVVSELGLVGQVKSWQVSFKPLREETARERSDRRKVDAETAQTLHDLGVIDGQEVRDGIRASDDHPYVLMDDADLEVLQEEEAEIDAERAALAAAALGADADGEDARDGGEPPEGEDEHEVERAGVAAPRGRA